MLARPLPVITGLKYLLTCMPVVTLLHETKHNSWPLTGALVCKGHRQLNSWGGNQILSTSPPISPCWRIMGSEVEKEREIWHEAAHKEEGGHRHAENVTETVAASRRQALGLSIMGEPGPEKDAQSLPLACREEHKDS